MTSAAPIERGVYFDAWFPWQHNYHPSFPPRRLRMLEHLEEYRATMLVWAALGGGNISLPYPRRKRGVRCRRATASTGS